MTGEDILWTKEDDIAIQEYKRKVQSGEIKPIKLDDLVTAHMKLQKVWNIINIKEVGWASPKVLIDTLKREVFEK